MFFIFWLAKSSEVVKSMRFLQHNAAFQSTAKFSMLRQIEIFSTDFFLYRVLNLFPLSNLIMALVSHKTYLVCFKLKVKIKPNHLLTTQAFMRFVRVFMLIDKMIGTQSGSDL